MDEHRALKVTPDRYLTYRYAGASGDYNPIHLEAQVARAQTEAAGDPLALESLEVRFRGVGLPEAEITITSEPAEDGRITCHAEQNGKKIVKGGKARLRS